MFYSLSIMIISFRIVQFAIELTPVVVTGSIIPQSIKEINVGNWINILDSTNTFLKVLLGLVQVEKMTRITIDIKALEK